MDVPPRRSSGRWWAARARGAVLRGERMAVVGATALIPGVPGVGGTSTPSCCGGLAAGADVCVSERSDLVTVVAFDTTAPIFRAPTARPSLSLTALAVTEPSSASDADAVELPPADAPLLAVPYSAWDCDWCSPLAAWS